MDVMAIEQSGGYRGHYYVPMGHCHRLMVLGPSNWA